MQAAVHCIFLLMTFPVCLNPSSTTSSILEDQCAHSVSQLHRCSCMQPHPWTVVHRRLHFQALWKSTFS